MTLPWRTTSSRASRIAGTGSRQPLDDAVLGDRSRDRNAENVLPPGMQTNLDGCRRADQSFARIDLPSASDRTSSVPSGDDALTERPSRSTGLIGIGRRVSFRARTPPIARGQEIDDDHSNVRSAPPPLCILFARVPPLEAGLARPARFQRTSQLAAAFRWPHPRGLGTRRARQIRASKTALLRTEGGMGLLWYSREKLGNCVIRVVYKTANDHCQLRRLHPDRRSSRGPVVRRPPRVRGADHGLTAREGRSTGSIYTFAKAAARPSKPGEWNTLEITLQGNRVITAINGVRSRIRRERPQAREPPTRPAKATRHAGLDPSRATSACRTTTRNRQSTSRTSRSGP